MEKKLTAEMVAVWIQKNPGKSVYEVEDGITVIDAGCFNGSRKNLPDNIVLPDSVEIIEPTAFGRCRNLKSVTLSKNLKQIGECAFISCRSIEKIEFPEGLVEIGDNAFLNCENLKKIKIPDSVKKIGKNVFSGCSSINQINHPCLSITKESCINFCNQEYEECLDKNIEEIEIPDSVRIIGGSAFENCKKLKKVIIPESVQEIDSDAFAGCSSLKEIVIPDSVKRIGNCAFSNCSSLEKINIPENVTSEWKFELLNNIGGPRGDKTFSGCVALTEETKEMLRKHKFEI